MTGTSGFTLRGGLASRGGVAYFTAVGFPTSNYRLYRTDGTAAGTRSLRDAAGITDRQFLATGSAVYFLELGISAANLLRIEGPADTVTQVSSLPPLAAFLGATSTHLFLRSRSTSASVDTLRAVDLATGAIRQIGTGLSGGSGASGEACFLRDLTNDRLLLLLGDTTRSVLSPIRRPNGFSSLPQTTVAALGARAVFTRYEESTGFELWSYDGGLDQAFRLSDLYPGPSDPNIQRVTAVGDRVLFTGETPAFGRELYVTDGARPARLLTDIAPGAAGSLLNETFARGGFIGNLVLFGAEAGVSGEEAWAVSVCLADFDSSGRIDPDDLATYIECYFASPPCPQADLNGDHAVDPDDLSDFITAFFSQAC